MRSLGKAVDRAFEYSGLVRAVARMRALGQQNSVFIWIPKNAGSSFFNLYREYGNAVKCKTPHLAKYRFPQKGHVTFGHMDYYELVSSGYVTREFDRSAYKFCFSRDPFARAVSLFFYLNGETSELTFLDFCRNLAANGAYPIGLYNRRRNSQCNPQVRWIENFSLDFVGRVETLAEDISKAMLAIDLAAAEPDIVNSTNHAPYQKYYCPESRDIVAEFYAEDFQHFGYPDELQLSE